MPHDAEKVAGDIGKTLQVVGPWMNKYKNNQSFLSEDDLAIAAALIHTIKLIFGLLEGANESNAVTGVFNLIRQMVILDSRNLDALLEMCDSWEGLVRCRAIQLLNMLREEHSIWRRKLKRGSFFYETFLSTFARTLETRDKRVCRGGGERNPRRGLS